MLSKFQRASDKIRILVQKRANFAALARRQSSMSDEKKNKENGSELPKNPIQCLYDMCKKTLLPSSFSPSQPSSQSVHNIRSILEKIGPSDVGLKEENPDEERGHGFFGLDQLNRVARWSQPITFLDLFGSDSFTICVFIFPTSSVIPLHDHPGMTVFSKILYGSLHVKSYDWVEPPVIQESKGQFRFPVRLAKLVKDEVLTDKGEASVLYPKSYGNLHCFTAVTPCAVLDVLTPPYREEAGRICTYYHDYPYSAFASENGDKVKDGSEDDYAWLVEVKNPDNLYMREGRYVGPTIRV